jgi:hypothetical protein
MTRTRRGDRVLRIEVVGALDAHAAEAFALEIRRLLKRYGQALTGVRIAVSTPGRRGRLA